jgi:hypothetical protein
MARIIWGLLPDYEPGGWLDQERERYGDVILGGCATPVYEDGTFDEWVCRDHPPAHLASLVDDAT